MKIPYFCCIGAELKRYAKDFDFMNQVYLYKVPTDDTMEEVLAQDYFQAIADTVLQDDLLYIYEPTAQVLHTCRFNKQAGHITAVQLANNVPGLTPNRVLISDSTGHITAGDVTLEYLKNKVNLDGTSIMTGPLKFRAGSFSGAIAGGLGDGISIYKLKADGTIDSEVASLTKTNGFTPGTTNAQNIGSPTLKWKDVHVARIITAVLNNGYDIAVPVTNGPDTLALKSEVDTAANSGRMITDQGVWFAKMYAATVPPAADDGTNYADFSQTDGDGNPIIVIYERQSGAWVQSQTVTPPANYDGYVPVTKKIWDIVEQTGQNGGRILWNHQSKEFTPYPNIVSFENIEVTGESTVDIPLNPVPQQIVNKDYVDSAVAASAATKANVDMDNLTSVGKNIANWSSNVSNCITEIPQDIKLELNNGTLTLKAGSKVYVPNGAGVFDAVTIASDISTAITTGADQYAIAVKSDGTQLRFTHLTTGTASGTTTPTSGYWTYYNATDNKIYAIQNGVNIGTFSFPVCIVSTDGSQITSIDQVFNGIGYIGSHVFFTPGYSVLTPNGRNADGTLANRKYTFSSCTIYTRNLTDNNIPLWVQYNGTILFSTGIDYDPITNQVGGGGGYAQVATADLAAGVISNFQPNLAFRAVDYSDTNVDFVVASQLPTSSNNYTWYRKYKSGWVEQGQKITDGTTSITLPVPMANDFYTITVGQNGAQSSEVRRAAISNQTTTGFNIHNNSANMRPIFWEVKGMAA